MTGEKNGSLFKADDPASVAALETACEAAWAQLEGEGFKPRPRRRVDCRSRFTRDSVRARISAARLRIGRSRLLAGVATSVALHVARVGRRPRTHVVTKSRS